MWSFYGVRYLPASIRGTPCSQLGIANHHPSNLPILRGSIYTKTNHWNHKSAKWYRKSRNILGKNYGEETNKNKLSSVFVL